MTGHNVQFFVSSVGGISGESCGDLRNPVVIIFVHDARAHSWNRVLSTPPTARGDFHAPEHIVAVAHVNAYRPMHDDAF